MRTHIYPKAATITMPVAGTMQKLPKKGDVNLFIKSAIVNWPGPEGSWYKVQKADSSVSIQYTTAVFSEDGTRLLNDLTERRNSLELFRKTLGTNLSFEPAEDPFVPSQPEDSIEVRSAGSLLLSMLWSEEVAQILEEVPEEDFPVLEQRIGRLISDEQIRFCSAIVGLVEADTRSLAIDVLVAKVRINAGLFTPFRRTGFYQIEHPSSVNQMLDINDPVLYGKQIITASLEGFEKRYNEFDRQAREYWSILGDKKLYTRRDLEALDVWMGINENPLLAGILPEQERDPIKKLNLARQEWLDLKQRIEQTRMILWNIGCLGAECAIKDEWPSLIDVRIEERSGWIARGIINDLGLPIAMALDYATSWDRLDNYILKYLLIDFKDAMKGSPSDPETRMETVKLVIIPQAVEHVMLTQMEFSLKHAYGGSKLRFMEITLPPKLEKEFATRDLGRGSEIKRAMLKDPRVLDDQLQNLQRWRQEFQLAFPERGMHSVDYILKEYQKRYEMVLSDADEIRFALSNVEKINDLRKVIDAILKRLNSKVFEQGEIDLPADIRIGSVYVKEGEHVREGNPVVSVHNRFSCAGKAFVALDEIPEGLTSSSIWQIELEGSTPVADNIYFVAIVSRIEPIEDQLWVIEMTLFAAVSCMIPKIFGIPEVLPLSAKYLTVAALGLTTELLNDVEQIFVARRMLNISFIKRIQ